MSIVNPFGSRDSGKSEPPVQSRPVTPGRRSASSLSKDRGAPKIQQPAPSVSAGLEQSRNQALQHSSSTTPTASTTHESAVTSSVSQYSHGESGSSAALSSSSRSVSDDVFNDLLTDDDETGILSEYTKARAADSSAFENTLSEFEEERKRLRRLYPTSGIKQSRFLLVDTLLKAPKTFFDAYAKDVEEGVIFVRNRLTDTGQSDLVRDAQEHPTEEEFQEKAFDAVHSLASESLAHSRWRDTHRAIIISLICNEIIGFGILDPLWRDSKVTEIMCNGPFDVQVEIAGEVYKVPCLRFKNANHLSDLLERLYRSVGKVLSQTTPRVKGRLHDKSRMFAVHTSVAPDGPNFNIRRHPQGFWTPQSMIDKGASSQEMMTFIGNLLYKGASCFVVGSTSSGKTSMLNALTGFYPERARILTLEDNLEMKPNPKKFLAAAMECKEPSNSDGGATGTSMRDLVHAAMQMRPSSILVGEVSNSAAYDLCQALNTGHSCMSTFHANSSQLSITRICSLVAQSGMTTIEGATDLVAAAFDFIINVRHFPMDGSRRIVSIDEVGMEPVEIGGRLTLPVRQLWRFVDDGLTPEGKVKGHWEQVSDISQARKDAKMLDMEKDLTWEQLRELSSLPEGELEV